MIYGAGKRGRELYEFLKFQQLEGVVKCFCDKNAREIASVEGKPVFCYEDLRNKGNQFIITLGREKDYEEVRKHLEVEGERVYSSIEEWAVNNKFDRVQWNRNYIAWYHDSQMEGYYAKAENELDTFWNPNSVFVKMFEQLNLDSVIELAAGRGRHVPMYKEKAKKILLVDILPKNINICKQRFTDEQKIEYYCNDGYDLKELADNSYKSLFCYDAMVHFELMDIYSYLKDIFRVLERGGKALIHHSNNTSDYKNDFSNTQHRRNYMSKDIFAYLACRCGFSVIEQRCIAWGDIPDLDCVSLLRKE